MRASIRLGRIAGLPVDLHVSVLAVIWLLAWNLATFVLPDSAPGRATSTYWLLGLAGAVVFLASLLAHELAHAVVARRAGVEVEGLTLWLLGGVASLGGQPPTPQADLRIAIVGPLTSLGLSVAFGATAGLAALLNLPDVLVALVAWLALINLVLAAFNLIPGAPLDGGRVLRALLWRRGGDWARAAITASRAGQAIGYGFIWFGFLDLVLMGISGLWFMLIGWFMLNASRDEFADVVTHHILRDVRVEQVMSRSVRTAPGWISVQYLVDRYLLEQPHSAYPVEDADGHIVGLVTLHQLRRVPTAARTSTPVADIALPLDHVALAAPSDPLVDAMERSTKHPDTGSRILVFEGEQLVGIVTPADVGRAIDMRTVRNASGPVPPSQPLEVQR